jgi:hypothetical protein
MDGMFLSDLFLHISMNKIKVSACIEDNNIMGILEHLTSIASLIKKVFGESLVEYIDQFLCPMNDVGE